MSLADVKHQAHAQGVIQRALQGDRLPHAYLFHGPDGVGKELLARGLAQLLLCGESHTVELPPEQAATVGLECLQAACDVCGNCRLVRAETHPDLHLIHRYLYREHPDSEVRRRKGLDLGIDVLRHFVIERVGLKPNQGRAKVFIVREADRITTPAQNALLKTLEEPPGATFIILLARSVDRLLPTTRSRCASVRFDALPPGFVAERLQQLAPELDDTARAWYARFSGGSLGRALECIEAKLYELNQRLLEHLAKLAQEPGALQVKTLTDESKELGDIYRTHDPDISDTEATRRGLKTLLHLIATWYADLLHTGSGTGDTLLVNTAARDLLAQADLSPANAGRAVNRIAEAERQLDLNAHTQLCLESLLHALSRIGNNKKPARGAARLRSNP